MFGVKRILFWRALSYGTAAFTFAWPLTEPSVAALSALAIVSGWWFAPSIPFQWQKFLAVALGLGAFCWVWPMTMPLTQLAPEPAVWIDQALRWTSASFLLGWLSRAGGQRIAAIDVLPLSVLVWSVTQLLIQHRMGATHRPFELADRVISRGGNAMWIFIAIGLLVSIAILTMLARGKLWVSVLLWVLMSLGIVAGMRLPSMSPKRGAFTVRGDALNENGKRQLEQDAARNNQTFDFKNNYAPPRQQAPVAVVVFHDDYSPPSGVYYFRQSALSQFNGRRLVQSTTEQVDADTHMSFPSRGTEVADAPEVGAFRTSVQTTVALLAEHPRPFGLESPVEIFPTPNPDPSRFFAAYKVHSAAVTSDLTSLLRRRPGNILWSKETFALYTSMPEDRRYRALAETLRDKLPFVIQADPVALAWGVTAWLSEEGTYSLKSQHAEAADPTADFLFGNKIGYCVHFAHAAVYLLRALGVPARVATGYAISEQARAGGSALLLRDQDAHAWPEIYVQDVGWIVMDVMPKRVLDPPPKHDDEDLQKYLGEIARGQNPLGTQTTLLTPWWAAQLKLWSRRLAMGVGLALVLGYFFGLSVKAYRRHIAWRTSSLTQGERVRRFYIAQLDRLSDIGIRRMHNESREAMANRLANDFEHFSLATHWLMNARYKATKRNPNMDQLRIAQAEMKAAVQRRTSTFRRLAALMRPYTWLRSR